MRDGHGAVVGEDGQLEVEGGAGAAVGVGDRQEGDASLLPQVVLKIELKTNYNFCFNQRKKIRESKKLVKKVGLAKNLKEGKVFEVDAEKQQNSLFDIPISLIEKLITFWFQSRNSLCRVPLRHFKESVTQTSLVTELG